MTRSAIGRILCPVDVARPSSSAVRCAFVLADWFGATIDALHVADASRLLAPDDTHVGWAARGMLERIVGHSASGVRVRLEATRGTTFGVILDRATSHRSDLIVLGASARPRPSFRSASGLADELAAETECPVLTVPEDFGDSFGKRILLPVDFSEATDAAVHWASVFATRFDAQVDVVHALGRPSFEPAGLLARSSCFGRIAGAVRRLQNIERRLRDAGVRATSNVLVEAPPLQAILELGERGPYDLVVVGVHERNPVSSRPGTGMVATLRRKSRIPLLSVLKARPTLIFLGSRTESTSSHRLLEIAS
jgi:nucleotide-binding universal stress UspA family protein